MSFSRPLANFKRLLRDRRGNVVVLTALTLPLLMGASGLAVDTIQWVLAKRSLQGAVDSAAIAGVYSLVKSEDPTTAADETLSTANELDPRRSLEVENPVPGREQDPFAVHVQVSVPARLTFSGLFLSKPPLITADATATVVETGKFCAFAIGSDSGTGVLVRSRAQVQGDCGIATNASSSKAVEIESDATVAVSRLLSFGGIDGQPATKGSARSFALRQTDPLENSEPPPIPKSGCPNITVNSGSGPRVTLQPGCYGNMVRNGSVWLEDGEYILSRGSFMVGPTASVSCRACTIILTSDDPQSEPGSIGTIQIDEHATVELAAPSQGPDAGIVFYQDRHAGMEHETLENKIAGNGFSKIQGVVYTPGEGLSVNGDFNADFSCARFISRRLILQGRLYISSDCSDANIVKLSGAEVRLIG